ncbi:MAG: hypothetical protein WC869_11445 [Phycisphaerae bacterium]|jgi:protein tyrosine phosphatase (PTP) superfamily phosphohydrolase (DUF442 family)
MNAQRLLGVLLPIGLVSLWVAPGCHTAYQCPILQPLTGGTIPAPLPPAPNDPNDSGSGEARRAYIGGIATHPAPEGDAYKVVGYRDGLRFYVVQYNDKLYRGGDILYREGAKALKDLGIKTIISVTPSGRERTLAKEFGFVLVEIQFGLGDLNRADLDRFLAAVESNPAPVYVHCFGGNLRVAILLAYYRIHKEGWTCERALNEYWRLDANYWDSVTMVQVLKANAVK